MWSVPGLQRGHAGEDNVPEINEKHVQVKENMTSSAPQEQGPPALEGRTEPYFTMTGVSRHYLTSLAHQDAGESGDEYCVDIYVPSGTAPAEGWPVILLLDATGCFSTCVEAMGRMARRGDATGVRQAIIAGISTPATAGNGGYDVARRQRDFTSPRPQEPMVAGKEGHAILPSRASGGQSGRDMPSGGAARFLDFIGRDVLPFIESLHPANPHNRTLLGHSLAGYFTLWALLSQPGLFRSYAAISPSLWWDWAGLTAALEDAPLSDQQVMIAVGEWEEALPPWHHGRPGSEDILSRRKQRRMIANAREIADRLARRLGHDQVRFHEMPEEDHASILSGAVVRMLRMASLP